MAVAILTLTGLRFLEEHVGESDGTDTGRQGRMMELPATPSAPLARQAPDSAPKRVLVVDDEPSVLIVTCRMLTRAGYVVMPETDGRALGRLIAERHPALPVLYMSAYPADDVFHRGSPGPDLPFLRKPFSTESLVAAGARVARTLSLSSGQQRRNGQIRKRCGSRCSSGPPRSGQ